MGYKIEGLEWAKKDHHPLKKPTYGDKCEQTLYNSYCLQDKTGLCSDPNINSNISNFVTK